MTVGAHRGACVNIHTSRSMASTINTSHKESFFSFVTTRSAAPDGQRLHRNEHRRHLDDRWHPNGRWWHPDGRWWHPDVRRRHLNGRRRHPNDRWLHLDNQQWHRMVDGNILTISSGIWTVGGDIHTFKMAAWWLARVHRSYERTHGHRE
jgi:hypothetical protein